MLAHSYFYFTKLLITLGIEAWNFTLELQAGATSGMKAATLTGSLLIPA